MDEYMSEADAWREIAARIEHGEWRVAGLCAEIDSLVDEGKITHDTECDMADRIEGEFSRREAEDGTRPRMYLFSPGHRTQRVALAKQFALDAEAHEKLMASDATGVQA